MKAGLKKSAKKSLIPVDYQVISQVLLLKKTYIQSKQRAAFPSRNHRPYYIITLNENGKNDSNPQRGFYALIHSQLTTSYSYCS